MCCLEIICLLLSLRLNFVLAVVSIYFGNVDAFMNNSSNYVRFYKIYSKQTYLKPSMVLSNTLKQYSVLWSYLWEGNHKSLAKFRETFFKPIS